LAISKDDPYRRRYGEIIGQDWGKVEKGFFDYAIKDVIVLRPTYRAIRKQALALVEEFGRSSTDILPMARQKFGLLTEAIQVKKAIALAQITRNGISVDLEWVRKTEAELRNELFEAVAAAQAISAIYKVDDNGIIITTGKTNTPAFDDNKLRDQLASIKEQIEGDTDTVLRIPLTKKGISRSVKVWSDYALLHPFLGHWIRAQSLAKLLQFFTPFRDEVDLDDLAGELQTDADDLADALRVERDEEGTAAVQIEELAKVATPKNRKLKKLGISSEKVLAAAQAIAAANRPPF